MRVEVLDQRQAPLEVLEPPQRVTTIEVFEGVSFSSGGGGGGFTPPVTFPGSWRVKADGTFQLWNPDQSKWHTLLVHGLVGAEYLTIGAGET
jgi:hypothetical protein